MFAREATGLVKNLSAYDSLIINLSFINLEVIFFLYVFTGLYPGSNIIYGILIAALGFIAITFLYMIMTLAIPRTGGEYVWVGRVIHPAIGLTVNFFFTVITLALISTNGDTIVSVFLAPGFTSAAIITGSSYYSTIATTLNQPWVLYLVSAFPLLLLIGVRRLTRFMWISFLIGLLAFPILIGTYLVAGHAGFVARFDASDATAYQSVLTSATSAGYTSKIALLGVFSASIFAFGNIIGTQSNAYFVGEIKSARRVRTQTIAMLGALLIAAGLAILVYLVMYGVLGTDFYGSVLFLFNNSPSNYSLPIGLPSPLAFLAYVTGNPAIPILVSILVTIGLIGAIIALPFIAVRNIFAWSFDRVIPEKFSHVDSRGNPWVAILLVTAISEIYAVVLHFLPLSTYLTYTFTGTLIVWIVVAITAIILPYRAKTAYNDAPAIVRRKIGGINLTTIVGVAAALICGTIAYGSLLPSYSGPVNLSYLAIMLGAFLFGVPIYYISLAARRRQGIRLELVFKEIPPE